MDIYLIAFIISITLVVMILFIVLKQKEQLKLVTQQKNDLSVQFAVLNTKYNEEIKSSKEKLQILQNTKDQLSREFELLANKIFEDKTKKFDLSHKQQFELMLQPFKEQIKEFSQQSKQQYVEESKERYLLKNELIRLKQMNEQLSQDAINLTNALKGENKTQGNWGEIILERILEQSGLREGSEYELQATYKSDEGGVYRPDVIIHMPQERDIIVDSKVSLVAYERYISSDEPEVKQKALKEHLQSIAMHVKGLSEKKYEKLEGVNTLDFVLLFMPVEGAFLSALEADGEFFKRAYESNILVVSPSTLLVTLRTIEHIWRTQRQEEHAKRIALEAEAMYDKLVLFVDEMVNIGNHLEKTTASYENAMKRLKTGRGSVIKRAENMKELGLKPKKVLNISSEEE